MSASAGFVTALVLFVGAVVLAGPANPDVSLETWGLTLGLFCAPVALSIVTWLARAGRRVPHLLAVAVAWLGAVVGGLVAVFFLARLAIGSEYSAGSIGLMTIVVCGGALSAASGVAGGALLCLRPSRRWYGDRAARAGR